VCRGTFHGTSLEQRRSTLYPNTSSYLQVAIAGTRFAIGARTMFASRFLRLSVVLAALVAAAGSAAVPQGYSREDAPGITVIKPEQASAAELVGRPFSLAFADGENGTDLMVRFLRAAHGQGATFLSDIEIHIVGGKGGAPEDCVTRVVPADHGQLQPQTVMEPGRYEQRQVLKPVSRMVTEYEYRCHSVSRPHTRTETHYESSYDFSSKSYKSHPVTRTVTDYRHEQECKSEPVTRYVTRYEYQMESQYVPAQWRTELRWMSDWDLDETPPACAPITRPLADARHPHLVQATIYFARK
jgi:hypothetical protein